MFRTTGRPSSGAQKLQLQRLVLHKFMVVGRCDGSADTRIHEHQVKDCWSNSFGDLVDGADVRGTFLK
jgi:hypothetical protein